MEQLANYARLHGTVCIEYGREAFRHRARERIEGKDGCAKLPCLGNLRVGVTEHAPRRGETNLFHTW